MRKNILKTIFALVPAIGMCAPLLSITSCGLQGDAEIVGDDIVKINQSKQYVVHINGKKCDNVTWNVSSSLEGQAAIDNDGILTGKAPGNVTIIAQYEINGSKHFVFRDITIKDLAMSPIPFNYFSCSHEGYLSGFNNWVTRDMLKPYDTFLVPSYVTSITVCAFSRDIDGDGDLDSTIPDNIVNLRFETDEDGMSNLEFIKIFAFSLSPFKSIIFPVSRKGLNISELTFDNSKVEHCYFAPNIKSIGYEAFINTQLDEVIFNNLYLDNGHIDNNVPPWMRKQQIIDPNSCVQYVGANAFSNCKKIKCHKISVYSSDVYQLDYYGRGPFAITDGTSEYSNIEFVDLTSYRGRESGTYLPSDLKGALNLDIHDCIYPGGLIPPMLMGRYLLYYDALDGSAKSDLEEDIRTSLDNLVSADGAMIGDWNFAAQSHFNFAVDVGDNLKLLYSPISWYREEDELVHSLRFKDCYTIGTPETDMVSYFPNDVIGTFDNIVWSDGVKAGRKLSIKQSATDPNILLLYCDVDNKEEIIGKEVSFDLTLCSPSWHMTYTYGHHDALASSEDPIDNHMIARF